MWCDTNIFTCGIQLSICIGANAVDAWPSAEVKFEVVKTIFDGAVDVSDIKKKMVVKMTKIVQTGDLADLRQPYVGYKNNTEETYDADSYLAFRCKAADNCVKLPHR